MQCNLKNYTDHLTPFDAYIFRLKDKVLMSCVELVLI